MMGTSLEFVMRGVLAGTYNMSSQIPRYVMIMPFMMANPAPRDLSSQPRRAFLNNVFIPQPSKLHKIKTTRNITPKLITWRNGFGGRSLFSKALISGKNRIPSHNPSTTPASEAISRINPRNRLLTTRKIRMTRMIISSTFIRDFYQSISSYVKANILNEKRLLTSLASYVICIVAD